MTTNDPDAIRSDIEATRADLGQNVDALADKVTPSKIVHRQTDKVRDAFRGVRDNVMGTASDVGDSAGSMAENVSDTVSDAAHKTVAKAKGNPLAVGLIAFGVGWLAASLIPASDAEKHLGHTVKEKAQPLVHEAGEVAKEMGENLKEPAQDAVDSVKQRATEGVENVKSEATDASEHVKSEAHDAASNVKDQGSSQV